MKCLDTLADAAGRAIGSDPESAAELLSFQSQCDPSAVLALVAAARALESIEQDPHCVYPGSPSQYQIGVADGHRCAAEKARVALAAIRGLG